MQEFSSPNSSYLSAKRSVDDRALNRHVLERLRTELSARTQPLKILELGAGLGTMPARMLDWGLIAEASYLMLDTEPEVILDAQRWLADWARGREYRVAADGNRLTVSGDALRLDVEFRAEEVASFVQYRNHESKFDLIVANAFWDLVDIPAILPAVLGLANPGGLFWFSINFDGETIFLPDHAGDAELLGVYHRSMDDRIRNGRKAGDSKSGRHLFEHLRSAGARIHAAGASDWVVHADESGRYPFEEKRFLGNIVDTVQAELMKHKEVPESVISEWTRARHSQIAAGELVYIAHQLDFVGRC